MRDEMHGIRYPWGEAPEPGGWLEVAEGVLWIRLPLPMVLDHVNVYALDEGDSWTLIDTGFHTKRSVAMWEELLKTALKGKPVSRVILTHHHPDHIGMAGWFMERGASLWASRTAWLLSRMLILDVEEAVTPQAVQFWREAGMDPDILAKRIAERPYNFADVCAPIPTGYTRLKDGDVLHAGGRTWDVLEGNGHAPEHLTFWSREDGLVLSGDQIICSISPNIGVYPTEPEADPVGEWIESCEKFSEVAREDHIVLAGHKRPFTGLPFRMRQLKENHVHGLDRLAEYIAEPKTAVECFPVLFKRKIDQGTYGLALVEAVAHLNHLFREGRATCKMSESGAWLWNKKG
ncbi:MBL fold metallo-hydrolase [Lentibacter sp. XHP0401]|uniref:MBL fold metallo-hydrolase n=1 Tax=Lentibacter sp. XHP0401 TaxID=2984334 RepID=UPI0021E83B61|nr:MBL fold metallo-hydrolase [Lentibacter sp. XHP0401]MCV2892925.1 MBL fold metallo-hydrolase [Lentibacter sp. XHP0401]